jgi:nucleolar GTP-binding protein
VGPPAGPAVDGRPRTGPSSTKTTLYGRPGYREAMSQPFEDLPTTPTADEVVDKAFSRAARAGRAKSGVDAQGSMLQTAANVVSDNLENVVTAWPDFSTLDPFYVDLADAVVRDVLDPVDEDLEGPAGRAGVDALRGHLNEVGWAGRKAGEIRREYEGRLRGEAETARKLRKQAFARIADVVEEVEWDLQALNEARDALRTLPDIRPDEPTIVVAGYPNVGKSSFVNAVTRASNEIASYPFTTTGIHVGHVEVDHSRYQLVDTPGLLDRPADERNEIESQAVSALEHAADAVLVLVDASGDCGYPLAAQLELRDEVRRRFAVPVLTVCNKADRSREVDADHYMSVTEDENVDAVLRAAVDAVDYEPELPYDG